jgi:hypothetical protein
MGRSRNCPLRTSCVLCTFFEKPMWQKPARICLRNSLPFSLPIELVSVGQKQLIVPRATPWPPKMP